MDNKSPLLYHFLALRRVFIVSVISVLVATCIVYYFFIQQLLEFITSPIRSRGVEIIYTTISEAMLTQLKLSLVSGIIVASPIIIWQIWSFIQPALYEKEIKSVKRFFFITLFLFLSGIAFCYGCIYNLAIDFFLTAGTNLANPYLSIDRYLNFMLSFLLPFGFSFNLPVIIYLTTKIGLTTPEMLTKNFKYVVLLIFVVAAVLTPPDIFSQIMLAVPLLLLYGISILVAKAITRKPKNND